MNIVTLGPRPRILSRSRSGVNVARSCARNSSGGSQRIAQLTVECNSRRPPLLHSLYCLCGRPPAREEILHDMPKTVKKRLNARRKPRRAPLARLDGKSLAHPAAAEDDDKAPVCDAINGDADMATRARRGCE